ncbi:MAG: cellulose biosynthesis cyclic di-GMP-binding regulatory protein BcsB [Fimbriimonas sp.]|nr:cellulose biosynthesis cyclic di-GMP-binding regulatory protein BcsB [Fimbriimonas sp.]
MDDSHILNPEEYMKATLTHRDKTTARLLKRRRRATLSLGATMFGLLAATAMIQPAYGAGGASNTNGATYGEHAYNMHPLNEDKVFVNPSNQWSYFFELKPGMDIYPGESYFSLDYSTSQTLLPGQGSITIFLNGYPLASRVLPPVNGDSIPWRVKLPDQYFKKGFNEIKVANRQKSSDGPCRDIDNYANWLKIGKNTVMHLVRKDPVTFPLMLYPFPYLDPLEDSAVRCHWMIPSDPSTDTIANMLNTASDWGKRLPSNGLNINVATRASGSPSGSALLISSNPTWSKFTPSNMTAKEGALVNFSATGSPGSSSLLITGADPTGLSAADGALAQNEMISQMGGTSSLVTTPAVDAAVPPGTRLGSFTFTDLGLPAIHLAGAFHQRTSLTIRRPLRCDLGRESYIKLKFRHSASMNPLRSLITIFLNGIPIGSAKLEPENANDGIIRARIPVEELAKNFWVIDIACFHDLGAADCSKSYDDVAWTVIEGESTFELSNGNLIGRPYLESFPYLIPSDGRVPGSIDFGFSANPSDEELTLAAVIAGRAAQTNRINLHWTSRKGEVSSVLRGGVVVGYYSEAQRFAQIKSELLVCPTGPGKFYVDPKVQLMPNTLVDGAVIQAVAAPKSQTGVLYVIMAQDNDALNLVTHILSNPNTADEIGGQVSVVTKDGRVIPLKVQGLKNNPDITKELNTYTPMMLGIMCVFVVALLGVGVWVAKQFVKKPKPVEADEEDESETEN